MRRTSLFLGLLLLSIFLASSVFCDRSKGKSLFPQHHAKLRNLQLDPSTDPSTIPSITDLPLSQSIDKTIIVPEKADNVTLYYKIYIPEKIDNEDLLIMAKPKTIYGDPDIIVSLKNPKPNITDYDYLCENFGMDVCVVPAANISSGIYVYVAIVLLDSATITIRADYSDEIILILGQAALIKFYKDVPEVARFEVPNNTTFEHVIVFANLLNAYDVNDTFSFYVNKGNTIPTTAEFDYFAEPIWNAGKGVALDKGAVDKEKGLIAGINYTILLEAPENALILLALEAHSNIRNIKLFDDAYDILNYDESTKYFVNVTYELTLSSEEATLMNDFDLVIELKPYSGDPDIYIHYDTLPDSLSKFHWNSTEYGHEILTITKAERNFLNATDRKFYITVVGKESSSYVLSVYPDDEEDGTFMEFGEEYTGNVLNQELVHYRLALYGKSWFNITLQLFSESGNAELYIKSCPAALKKNKCQITKEDLTNKLQLVKASNENNNTFFYYSANPTGMDLISFTHNYTLCDDDTSTDGQEQIKVCNYAIGVVGNSSRQQESHYSLVAKHKRKHLILMENNQIHSLVEEGEADYYKFTLPSNMDILRVSIQDHILSGNIEVFVSRNSQFPNSTDNECGSYLEADSCDFYPDAETTFKPDYYITVQGVAESFYTLIILVDVKQSQNKTEHSIKYNRLVEGIPIIISNDNQTLNTYFYFSVSYPETEKNVSLAIAFRPTTAQFRVYVTSDDSDPSPTNFQWEFIQDFLSITDETQGFIRNGTYRILVQLHSVNVAKYQYNIMFTTSDSLIVIPSGQTFYGYLENEEADFFTFSVHSDDEAIQIVNQAYVTKTDSISLFLATDQTNFYPSSTWFDYKLTNGNGSMVLTKEDDFKMKCPNLYTNKKPCNIHLQVASHNETVFYSLLISRRSAPIMINDGVSVEVKLPEASQYSHIYFYLPENSTVTIFLTSRYAKLEVYFNVVELNKNGKKTVTEIDYPTQESFLLKMDSFETVTGQNMIIKRKDYENKNCLFPNQCVLCISATLSSEFQEDIGNITSTFSIQASTQILNLLEGTPIVDYVEEKMIKYYTIRVPKPDSILLVTVTPIGAGDPDLVVSMGEEERPTFESYDFISATYKSEQLQIERKNNTVTEKGMNGVFVIGVYGYSNCTFILTAAFSTHKISYLAPGLPTDGVLSEKDVIFFEYYHYTNTSFRVILSKEYGDTMALINTYNKNEDYYSTLPLQNRSNFYWSTSEVNDRSRGIVHIKKEHSKFCQFCTYLISVTGLTPGSLSKFTLVISREGSSINLQSGRTLHDSVDKNETILYNFLSSTSAADINILIFSGAPEVYLAESREATITDYDKKYDAKDFISNRLSVKLGENSSGSNALLRSLNTRFSILIRGNTQCFYSIVATSVQEKKILRMGTVDYTSLLPGSEQTYLFFNDQNSLKVNLLFALHDKELFKTSEQSNMTKQLFPNLVLEFVPQIEENHKGNNSSIARNLTYTNVTTQNSILYRFEADKGRVLIKISNRQPIALKQNYTLNFSLMVNSKDMNLLLPDSYQLMSLETDKNDNYELYSPDEGKMLIEIFQCSGKVELSAYSNYDDFKKKNKDLQVEHPRNNHLVAVYNVKQGPVFLSVFAKKEMKSEQKEHLYVIKTHLLPKSAIIPQEKFYPLKDGNIKWSLPRVNSDDISISIGAIVCENQCKFQQSGVVNVYLRPQTYSYTLHISDNETMLSSFSKCNLDRDSFSEFSSSCLQSEQSSFFYRKYFLTYSPNEHPEGINFTIAKSDLVANGTVGAPGPYFVNVVAEVFFKEETLDNLEIFTILYNQAEIYTKIGADNIEVQKPFYEDKMLLALIIGGSLLLVVATGAFCYYRKKYGKIKKKMKYELSELGEGKNPDDEVFERENNPEKMQNFQYKGFIEKEAARSENT